MKQKKRTKRTKFGSKLIRINPDKGELDSFRTIDEIFRKIKQSIKKTLIKFKLDSQDQCLNQII